MTTTSRLSVRMQPRARTNEVVGWRKGVLVVRVTAPPVDGRANEALCELLADRLGVAKRDVTLIAGATSRDKVVEIAGVGGDDLRRRIGSGE
ncbi:MAG TPA: DUF167 domain-containing protein [Candidatus Limnocylindria bacterium]|nr:DUF167 domain-containing protein [Candidatus Limnocylindria bacterium]